MLKKLPAPLKGTLNALFLASHTLFWCIPMYALFVLKLLSPTQKCRAWTDKALVFTANHWIQSNNLFMTLTHDTLLQTPDFAKLNLKLNDWYFITVNHQCWTDILILQKIFLYQIPFIRFFIKKELMLIPVFGAAWWAYDFPIMSRYSKETLQKKPHLKGKDLLKTQKSCDIFKNYPVTILNFLEGTRFTKQKQAQQNSPYQELLKPKLGGFSFALQAMDQKIKHILDVTIIYPHGRLSFWDFLCGRVKKIVIDIKPKEVPTQFLDWQNPDDPHLRSEFGEWINALWLEKDRLIKQHTAKVN